MSPLARWALPLRLARRDALRHKARSVLVLVMIALPVLAVTAADVLMQTSDVSGAESLDRRMGAAQALVTVGEEAAPVAQPPDPDDCCVQEDGAGTGQPPTADQVSALLDGAALLELRRGQVPFATERGRTSAEAVEVDLRDPVTTGLYDLTSGRLPRSEAEVVVNQALLDEGYAVGDVLDLTTDGPPAPTIVGVAESTTSRSYPVAFGLLGSLGVDTHGSRQWLVDGGPVSWAVVRQLNAIGAVVASRGVIEHPPPPSQWPPQVQPTPTDDATVAVLGLIGVMALIELVLLAGPAFAVGARRQQRSLALLAAAGGTPQQARRVVMAGALVLGGVAALAGVVLGIGVARLSEPLLQRRSDSWFGPFQVPWLHLVAIAGFGVLSAAAAAFVPAYLASRQDVVAVLAGRRGDQAPSLRSPLLGLVLLGLGVAGSAAGASGRFVSPAELLIAASAIPAILGMVLLVPIVLTGLARVSRGLPLVLRYAIRDANRHRTRTVPAVSAVAATVAGVVALGIGVTSDEAENEARYTPSVAAGVGIVAGPGQDVPWSTVETVVRRALPTATVTPQQGLPDDGGYTEVRAPGTSLDSSGSSLGASVMVSDGELPRGLIGISASEAEQARGMLAAGGVVAFASRGGVADGSVVRVVRHTFDPETGEDTGVERASARAVFIDVDGSWVGPAAILAPAVAEQLGTAPTTVSLAVTGATVSEQQQKTLDEELAALSDNVSLYVERGYQADDETLIAQLVLVVLGGVLMLGGTLTATFLALSDARPDLATLSAVGAAPGTRRGVAAAYAVVVGLVGAVLGAAVGFVPGLAVARPLTSTSYGGGPTGEEVLSSSGPYLDVPWLMVLGLVVVLPAVTAAVVGTTARSRLPMVTRLD